MLEPAQALPTIVEDNVFLGAMSEVVEGVIVGEGSVLSMGIYIGQSTKIVDRKTGEITYGKIPPYSVVVPGSLPDKNNPKAPSLNCAVIIKKLMKKLVLKLLLTSYCEINENNFDCVLLTQDLVKCKSITPNDDGALQVVEDHLRTLGFNCTRLPFKEKGYEDVDNLFAIIGNSGQHLSFAGHTDVVPPGNEISWNYPPFAAAIKDGKLYGRGSEDMKGNIACFISATNSFLKNMEIILMEKFHLLLQVMKKKKPSMAQ